MKSVEIRSPNWVTSGSIPRSANGADKIMPIMPPPLPPPSKPAGDGALADSEGESSEHDGLSKRRRLETVTLTLEPEALSQLQP